MHEENMNLEVIDKKIKNLNLWQMLSVFTIAFVLLMAMGVMFVASENITTSAITTNEGNIADWDYYLAGDVVHINKYIGNDVDVVLPYPDEFGGTVFEIEELPFTGIFVDVKDTMRSCKLQGKIQGSLNSLFYKCTALENVDVSNLDTSAVTSMYYMFSYCSGLTTLDLSNFDTSNVTNMVCMFYYASGLESLDLSNFDTSNVTDMDRLFSECSSIRSIDLTNFNTSKSKRLSYMFYTCSSLETIDISGFDTSSATDMYGMFSFCSSLKSIDISHFNTANVTNMGGLFRACSSLESVNLGSIELSGYIQSFAYWFSGCSSLKEIDFSGLDLRGIRDLNNTFVGCTSLEKLDLSNFTINQYTNVNYVFKDCSQPLIVYAGTQEAVDRLASSSNKPASVNVILQGTKIITFLDENNEQISNELFQDGIVPVEYTLPNAPDKARYDFLYWVNEANESITNENLSRTLVSDLILRPRYIPSQYTLTVNYVYSGDNVPAANDTYPRISTQDVGYQEEYTIILPIATGYETTDIISGIMDDEGKQVTITFIPKDYVLSINYLYDNGAEINSINQSVTFNTSYSIVSPVIQDYTPTQAVVEGIMNSEGKIIDVVYDENPIYKTIYYQENLDGSWSQTVEEKRAVLGSTVNAEIKEFTGYVQNSQNVESVLSGEIIKGEELVLKVYYDRQKFNIVFENYDGTELVIKSYKYMQMPIYIGTPVRESDGIRIFQFAEWKEKATNAEITEVTGEAVYIANYKVIILKTNENSSVKAEIQFDENINVDIETRLEVIYEEAKGYAVKMFNAENQDITNIIANKATLRIQLPDNLINKNLEIVYEKNNQTIKQELKVNNGVMSVGLDGFTSFSIEEKVGEIVSGNTSINKLIVLVGISSSILVLLLIVNLFRLSYKKNKLKKLREVEVRKLNLSNL